jgi:hypothetical protein
MKMNRFRYNPNLRFIEGEEGGGSGVSEASEAVAPEDNGTGGMNPAWSPLLDKLPEGFHGMVAPVLRDWDKNFDSKLHEVQSKFEPYQPFVEQGVDPDQLNAALEFYRMAEADPKAIYEQMGTFFGFGAGQGQDGQELSDGEEPFSLEEDELSKNPKFQELMQNQQAIAQVLLKQREQEEMALVEQQIETEVNSIKEAHPDLSEQEETMMFQLALSSKITLTQAAEQLFSYKDQITQQFAQGRPTPPSVMSATGTVPGQTPIDPTKLDSKGTKSLVAQIMAAQNNGN